MSENKNHTVENMPEEIEKNRLIFKRDAEKRIYDAVCNALEDIFKDNACDNRPAENNGCSLSDNGKDEKIRTKIELLPSPMGWILLGYVAIIVSVLFRVFKCGLDKYVSNNTCIVLVTILILATIVLILAGRYCVVMMQLQYEKEKADKKDEKKKSEPEPSFREKVLKRTQEAVLDKVVEDTLKSFD